MTGYTSRAGAAAPRFPRAQCAGQTDRFTQVNDPYVQYADTPEQRDHVETCRQICASCAHESECLTWALDHNEKVGIWGGTTPDERQRFTQFVRDMTGQRARS